MTRKPKERDYDYKRAENTELELDSIDQSIIVVKTSVKIIIKSGLPLMIPGFLAAD